MRRALATILFFFEPFLAASLLLRVGPTLTQRDGWTALALTARLLLAAVCVSAAIGISGSRPFGRHLAIMALTASAGFAVVQLYTRVLPTSLAPDVAPLFTLLIVAHHAAWILYLVRRP
ncbi:MAG: hypothetical protein M3R55_04940 [Acidobacteriota bacterium]|nr:hypothetical protein [Acidobacteriota bacterium]